MSLLNLHTEFGVAKCPLQTTPGGICTEQHFALKLGLQLTDGKDAAAGNKIKILPLCCSPEMQSKCMESTSKERKRWHCWNPWLPCSLREGSCTEMICPAEVMCIGAQNFFCSKSEVLEMHSVVERDYFGSLCWIWCSLSAQELGLAFNSVYCSLWNVNLNTSVLLRIWGQRVLL